MEQIKISVDVNINLSEDVKSFIAQVITSASKPAAQVSTSKPAAQVSTSKPAPAASKPAAQVSASKPTPAASEISIEDVRKALSLKVNSHRTEIKSKLNEFGAPSVTKLNPANYQEMLDFLNTLD